MEPTHTKISNNLYRNSSCLWSAIHLHIFFDRARMHGIYDG